MPYVKNMCTIHQMPTVNMHKKNKIISKSVFNVLKLKFVVLRNQQCDDPENINRT